MPAPRARARRRAAVASVPNKRATRSRSSVGALACLPLRPPEAEMRAECPPSEQTGQCEPGGAWSNCRSARMQQRALSQLAATMPLPHSNRGASPPTSARLAVAADEDRVSPTQRQHCRSLPGIRKAGPLRRCDADPDPEAGRAEVRQCNRRVERRRKGQSERPEGTRLARVAGSGRDVGQARVEGEAGLVMRSGRRLAWTSWRPRGQVRRIAGGSSP